MKFLPDFNPANSLEQYLRGIMGRKSNRQSPYDLDQAVGIAAVKQDRFLDGGAQIRLPKLGEGVCCQGIVIGQPVGMRGGDWRLIEQAEGGIVARREICQTILYRRAERRGLRCR